MLAHERVLAGDSLRKRFDPGPEGATCNPCVHLFAKRYAGTYYKVELRGDTHGPGSNYRIQWLACGTYEPGGE